ncbi:hypothetical protein [Pseudomonas sp. PSKL.D1]|uniref:hypothetical protein n=1 Tax=Pseudomonas sp. PSKL.D1 TaxID=3029060 RepID=UPI0023812D6E|nr:hypothetical protein [Pseudomonas sp. PSKL.D1]WDY56565.1 hypothetical protein PVV54_18490 [Pseudomonas sp. PSKL.D1]
MFHKIAQSENGCTSVIIEMPAKQYIELVEEIYRNEQGGLPGQRAALKTKTAKIIRERMVTDISRGASLPPVVVGVLVDSDSYTAQTESLVSRDDMLSLVRGIESSRLSIIDGMQRTTAILEAAKESGYDGVSDLRVEFWISDSANNLIYRMLVLNTGQVPWDIARQLEAIYRPLLEKVEASVEGTIRFLSKDSGRRSNLSASEYESEDVVELLLIFSSRKRELNLKDKIAQDFVRLDMIESSSHVDVMRYFTEAILLLSKLNTAFSSFEAESSLSETLSRFSSGREVFRAFPAKAGFVSALSIYLFGKPGMETDWQAVPEKFNVVQRNIARLIEAIQAAESPEDKEVVLCLEDLEERITAHRVAASQVGRFEREYFEKAFGALFEDGDLLQNFKACWQAY